MQRIKRLKILALIFVVLCAATLAVTKYEEKKEEIQASDTVIFEVSQDDVEAFAFETTGTSLAFHKEADQWYYDEDSDFPVDNEKIEEILAHFEAFGVHFIIENVEDYSQYGLNQPETTITLTTADDSYEIHLGLYSTMDSQRYIDIGDGNVYLVSEDPNEYLPSDLSSMILDDETPDFDTAAHIHFSGASAEDIISMENSDATYSADDIYFIEKNGEMLPLDTEKVTAYLDTISNLSLSDYVTYNATDEMLENYGLKEPQISVEIDYTFENAGSEDSTDVFTLSVGQNQEEYAAYLKAVEENSEELPNVTKYVRIGNSKIIYLLSDSDYDTLTEASYNDLRHSKIFWADFDTVTQVDITLEGNTHTLTSVSDSTDENERTWYFGDTTLDIFTFKNALSDLVSTSFTDELAEQKEEIHLTFYLDNSSIPQVDIALYRYDGSLCLAYVDGESTAFVERSKVIDLIEAVQEIILND